VVVMPTPQVGKERVRANTSRNQAFPSAESDLIDLWTDPSASF
jgi:hypothetical protein